jgi:hypothetical protein
MIAMDIDGTLLNSTGQIPAENLQAIEEAAARGIEIVLVTGRRFDFALPIAEKIPGDPHLIVNNGALAKSLTVRPISAPCCRARARSRSSEPPKNSGNSPVWFSTAAKVIGSFWKR